MIQETYGNTTYDWIKSESDDGWSHDLNLWRWGGVLSKQ